MKRITTARGFFDSVMRSLREVGYDGLTDYEKEICDAFDGGRLTIIESSLIQDWAEERHAETGKWPGE